jgi:GTP-binding protein Era
MDSTRKWEVADQPLLHALKSARSPAFLLLNKIDLLHKNKQKLLPLIEQYARLHEIREVIPISARKRLGLDLLLQKLVENLPHGPAYFPEDQVTDQPARFMAAELIREQVLLATSEEVPHSVTVLIEEFEEGPKLTRIAAAIYCEREGQKRILIGHGGQMLKKIGTNARLEIEKMIGTKVYLELFVKVRPNWRESRGFVEALDWRRQLEDLVGGETRRG